MGDYQKKNEVAKSGEKEIRKWKWGKWNRNQAKSKPAFHDDLSPTR